MLTDLQKKGALFFHFSPWFFYFLNLLASRVNLIMIVVSSLPLALTMSRLFLVSKNYPFLVSTWYRPPDSPVSLFNEFEELVRKIDTGN